jgi:FAD/FMN-containing dehydrogenase
MREAGMIVDAAGIEALRGDLAGQVVTAEDADYEQRRVVFNTMFDCRPAAIVLAANADDVVRTMNFAGEHDLPLAVRSGGHSLAGHGSRDGALVLDLGALRTLRVDPARHLAWAEPGITAGEYASQAQTFGLATPFGDNRSVGVGGLTLSGGVGYLSRKLGLTVDSLVSAEMVTADGRRLTASDEEHPDLFWAIRGGGGNFGVATQLCFRLYPVGMVYGGWLVLPATRGVLAGCAELAAAAPEELTIIANVFRMPSLDLVAPTVHGKLVVAITAVFAGDLQSGEHALAPFRRLAQPLADELGPLPYPDVFRFSRNAGLGPHGTAARTTFLRSVGDDVVEATLDHTANAPSAYAAAQLRFLRGAICRVRDDETAYAFRDREVMFSSYIEFDAGLDAAPYLEWTEAFWRRVRPHGSGAYVGFLQDEGEARVREAYPPATFARLAEIKRTYDPLNRFRFNQNIPPAP